MKKKKKNLFIGITGPWNSIVQQQYFTGLYYYHGYGFLKISKKGIEFIKKQVIKGYKRAASFLKLLNDPENIDTN